MRRLRRGLDVNLRSGPQMQEYVAIADRLAKQVRGAVLDWGCGFGQLTHLLHERSVDATAFDYRAGARSEVIALEHYPTIAVHVSGDPVKLPFADNSFEAALSCGVLEHVQYPDDSLDELRRVLRPGGHLYVYKLPNRYSYLEAIARVAGFYYHGKLPHDRVYTRRTARVLLERHRFRVLAVRSTNLLPLTLAGIRSRTLSRGVWNLNRALGHLPLARVIATNIELDARR
jgi:ubiquinone/menaquinone biosynthesis C-methylase UbiE